MFAIDDFNLHEPGERSFLGRANWVKDPPELCLLPASSMARTNFQVPHVPHLQFHILCLCTSEHEVCPTVPSVYGSSRGHSSITDDVAGRPGSSMHLVCACVYVKLHVATVSLRMKYIVRHKIWDPYFSLSLSVLTLSPGVRREHFFWGTRRLILQIQRVR